MTRLRHLFDPGHGGARSAEAVAGSLRAGRSVVLAVAGEEPADLLCQGIRQRLWQGGVDHLALATREEPVRSPLGSLARALGLDGNDPGIVELEDRVRSAPGIPHVVELADVRSMPDAERREWLGFVAQWSRVARPREGGHPPRPAFLVVLEAGSAGAVVSSTPSLLVEELWGLATAADRQHLADAEADELPDELPLQRAWRCHLLPPLLPGDAALADALWDHLDSFSDLLEGLSAVAEERGWPESETRAWVSDLLGSQGRPLPIAGPARDRLRPYWIRGGLEVGPEDGIQLSSAALVRAGAHAEVRHRYWTGQVRLVLPQLNRARLRLCRELTDGLGESWVRVGGTGDASGKEALREPLDQEFGEILVALCQVPALKRFRQLRLAVENVRWTRNELAHYRPVSFPHYRQLQDQIEKGWAELRRG
ncbi:MAG: hypothetical protein M5U13_15790 [Thermoanaerobaculia bacterium]|nr:hypothetical protein [Thermoanaerobaculia bacterium]